VESREVHPNPASAFLFIEGIGHEDVVEIFSVTANRVLTCAGSPIHIATLPAGIYLVRVTGASGTKHGRFIRTDGTF
jgi:hypothetical protein